MYLRATAFYTDGHGSGKSESGMSEQKVYAAPVFATATAGRSVAEDTAAGMDIGAPVAATDADNDTLTYTLGGTDRASFAINRATGQLMTRAALDFEMKPSYSVTVTASDGEEAGHRHGDRHGYQRGRDGNGDAVGYATHGWDAELTAMLSDLDDGITGTTWQWASSDAMTC